MPVKLRNKNQLLYTLLLALKRLIHSNGFLLMPYLRIKESVITRKIGIDYNGVDALFEKIFIETVAHCNNNCDFCPLPGKIKAGAPLNFMSEELFMKIILELKSIFYKGSVAFHCNNEPLLDGRLASWIKIARANLKHNFFYIYTNGILLSVTAAQELFDAGLNRIIFNCYARGQEVINTVKKLTREDVLLRGELVIQYRRKDEYLGNRAGQSPNSRFSLKRPLEIMCLRPQREIVVCYDGTIPLCCADALLKSVMGNAREKSLREIWFADSFRRIRRALAERDRSCTEICKKCDSLQLPRYLG